MTLLTTKKPYDLRNTDQNIFILTLFWIILNFLVPLPGIYFVSTYCDEQNGCQSQGWRAKVNVFEVIKYAKFENGGKNQTS